MATKKISKIKSPASAKASAGKQKSKVQVKAKKLVKKTVAKKVVKITKVAAKKSVKAVKVEARITASSPKKAVNLNVSVLDTKGKITGHVTLPVEIFGAKINNSLMSQAVRVYLANQRQGTSKTKDRGEVDRTTKKIYQQKGTGRARHGSRRAPIYVGGGRVFGPRPRDLSLSISQKMKTLALFSALSSKLKDSEIKIIKGLETILPKTKLMAEVLENLGINNDKKVLLVMSKPKESENVYRAGRNIEGLEILNANSLNTYKVLDNKLVLLMRDSIDSLKDTFIKSRK
jgi:large subunit ribosomal protein L4